MIEKMGELTIRNAGPADHHALAVLLNSTNQVHRHLDWRTPLEWLGEHPFLLAEQHGQTEAVLACPPDPPHVAWVRLFCADDPIYRSRLWKRLLEAVLAQLQKLADPPVLAAISLQDWFARLLVHSGFESPQKIVVLEWSGQLPDPVRLSSEIRIREMHPEDLPAVHLVDQQAFEPLWQNSEQSLRLAYEQSVWSTVAETNGELVGYQISTGMSLTGHLARLAVVPQLQRARLGYALVQDLLSHFSATRAWRVTVNTQNDNRASLALYEKTGFRRTGEEFPVYQHPGYG